MASSTSTGLPDTFIVSGIVTDGMRPVADAIVMQGGAAPPYFTTGPDGAFSIMLTTTLPGTPSVVAAKLGYRSDGIEIIDYSTDAVSLTIYEAKGPDNALGYHYGAPGTGDVAHDTSTLYCGHCHTTYVADFQTSLHAKATRDPLVQDLYAGVAGVIANATACVSAGGEWKTGLVPGAPTTSASKCYLGRGVLGDLNECGSGKTCDDPSLPDGEKPTAFGLCADCHAAGLDGIAGGRNLHDATGIAFEDGNHCDACHHVRDIDMSSTAPGVAGRLILQRPREKLNDTPSSPYRQVMYGPYPDVPNHFMGGSYQPKFASADFCSGCHEYAQRALLPGSSLDESKWPDGLPALSTYSEWSQSAYAAEGTQCQACHMPPVETLVNTVDVTTQGDANTVFGFVRAPEQMRAHTFQGPLHGAHELIENAFSGSVNATQNGPSLDVEVTLTNAGAGHAIPTSEPMRSILMTVEVEGCSLSFVATGGMTVPDFGGATVRGTVGDGVTVSANELTWGQGAQLAKAGDRIRITRPSGVYDDYPGIGYFGNGTLAPEDKGMQIDTPVGEATVVAISGSVLTLSGAPPALPGDIVYLGDSLPANLADGDPSRALAGAPGYAFARVMVDPAGVRFVPHYRAVDIASDNRLPPGVDVNTQHTFAIPSGCLEAEVRATVLYRPLPLPLARERAWDGRDFVVYQASSVITLAP